MEQELIDPQRNIATSVLVRGDILPPTSMRLTNPIPRDRVFDAASKVKKYTLTAPVKAGTVVTPRLMGYDTDVIVTKSVPEDR